MTCILSHDNCLFSVVKLRHRFCAVDCGAVRRVMGVVFSLPLSQYHSHSLSPDQRNIIWNSRRGFTIRSPTFFYIGLFFCQTTGDIVRHQSRRYFVHRIGQQALSAQLYKSCVNMYVCINGFCAKSLIFYFFLSQWIKSKMCVWTAVNIRRPWRDGNWSWTALPLQSWTPESTSHGTTLERSELLYSLWRWKKHMFRRKMTFDREEPPSQNIYSISQACYILYSSKHLRDYIHIYFAE